MSWTNCFMRIIWSGYLPQGIQTEIARKFTNTPDIQGGDSRAAARFLLIFWLTFFYYSFCHKMNMKTRNRIKLLLHVKSLRSHLSVIALYKRDVFKSGDDSSCYVRMLFPMYFKQLGNMEQNDIYSFLLLVSFSAVCFTAGRADEY